MKMYDIVKITKDSDYLFKQGVRAGREGKIIEPEIENGCFSVLFVDRCNTEPDVIADVKIEDLEVVENGFASDDILLEEIGERSSNKWCKVVNGFIMNILGEKKNKVAFDYNS